MNLKDSNGQILLAVILIAVIALTVGLSLVSRSITGVRVATQSEESQRAFQAAEAGIERAINAIRISPTPPASLTDSLSNNAEYETTLRTISGNQLPLNGGNLLEQDIGSDVWLARYPNYASPLTTTIRLYFGEENQSECLGTGAGVTPAIELLILSGSNPATPTLSKYIIDPCSRIAGSDAGGVGGDVAGKNYRYSSASISVTNGLIARVVPLYNSTIAGISSTSQLPSQGTTIESIGASGESKRKIIVFQSNPQIPIEIFQYAILSQ